MQVVRAPLTLGLFSRLGEKLAAWQAEKAASPRFQQWASRFPLTKPFVRRDADRLYDLVAGFVYSQTLLACVELDLFRRLKDRPQDPKSLAALLGLDPARLETLLQAAVAIELLIKCSGNRYGLGRLGAAVLGVAGLEEMIRHHRVFYRDLRDPVALLRNQAETELANFWPYVEGKSADIPAQAAAVYSELMAQSQAQVVEETVSAISLHDVTHLADIGGGSGVFIEHVMQLYAHLSATLFDLPAVADVARTRLARSKNQSRITVMGGSFLHDPLPALADAASLIRVLYDHEDEVVAQLLERLFAQLPAGGQLIISEPMSGGARPTKSGDAYFGFYTMAMTTGRPRSPDQHRAFLTAAGFERIRLHANARPFITRIMTARKPR